MTDRQPEHDAREDATEIIIYGSTWCPYTTRALRWLDGWKVPYRWVDVDADPAAERQIAEWNEGRAVRPTFDIGGEILVHPDQKILQDALEAHGLLPA